MDAITIKESFEEASALSEKAQELTNTGDGARSGKFRGETLDAFLEVLIGAVEGDRKAMYVLKEAMHTADFPVLFGDTLDRSVLAAYKNWEPVWKSYVKMGTVRDFRPAKRYGVEGGQSIFEQVLERGEYPERGISESTPVEVTVAKYGARMGINFEALINDDLGLLRDFPQRLATGARRSEAVSVAQTILDSSGPLSSVFSTGNKNCAATSLGMTTANAPLTVQALGEALGIMGNQVDADGHPILIEGAVLVVGPALKTVAKNILNALQIEAYGAFGSDGAGKDAAGYTLWSENWLKNELSLVVDPYIPYVDTTHGKTDWFIFAGSGFGEAGIEMTQLVGHQGPELFMRAPDASRLGGGLVAESFDTETIEYKCRLIYGTKVIDPKMMFASNGSGS